MNLFSQTYLVYELSFNTNYFIFVFHKLGMSWLIKFHTLHN